MHGHQATEEISSEQKEDLCFSPPSLAETAEEFQHLGKGKVRNLNCPIYVAEDNDHLGLIVSGQDEEMKNVDIKIDLARQMLYNLLGIIF